MRQKLSLSMDEAVAALRAGVAAAQASSPVSIAVVDEAGALLAFQRMDGARAHTVDLAMQKARQSALVGVPTAAIVAAGVREALPGGCR